MPIHLDAATCSHLPDSARREWLETNGIGGYASSTVSGCNTRRYHGLLVAALQPPCGRAVLLSKLEETLVVAGARYELGTNRFPGAPDPAIHPQGYRLQTSFRLAPYPIATFSVPGAAGDVVLEKHVIMLQGENAVVVQYVLVSGGCEARLELRPLIAFRDHHALTHENPALDPGFTNTACASGGAGSQVLEVHPYAALPPMRLSHNAREAQPAGYWYRSFEYEAELVRGFDFREDLFNPCVLTFDLSCGDLDSGRSAVCIASLEPQDPAQAGTLVSREIERRRALLLPSTPSRAGAETGEASDPSSGLIPALTAAADAFLVRRGDGDSVIAGYHWFSDWGRDTMISLPGLSLVTGRTEVARGILRAFAEQMDAGMIPNRFPDAGETPEYNTVDGTLWMFQAVASFLRYTGDYTWVKENLYHPLAESIGWHLRGTRYGIHADSDGLLLAGAPETQLTWMDARVGNVPVTPRAGKPVEIQALWYNALRLMRDLAERLEGEDSARTYSALAARVRSSFIRSFWDETAGCLYDVIDGQNRDASIRPNQLLALSLPHPLVGRARALSVLRVVEERLLTPYGLRTLAPDDPRYRGRYEGDAASRDSAYHQGTVWPWLLGPFLSAYVKTHNRSPAARKQAAAWLEPFRGHLRDAGLGQISEIFDGDPPYEPRGCIAQAWSVAELLRVAREDIWPEHF